jgi:hypothetical protein
MERFEIRPASRVHCTQLANYLRATDVLEIWRASGQEPLEALLSSIRDSDEDMCWTALLRGHPVAIFGANNMTIEDPDGNVIDEDLSLGGIWLLASPGIYENKLDFMRNCKKYLRKMHERYEYLTNFIDIDNAPTQAWLSRMNFKPIQLVENFGFARTPFIQYVSKRGNY